MSQSDMMILAEIRQIQAALPSLKSKAKEAAEIYRRGFANLGPYRAESKAAKAALKAAQARLDELCRPEGGTP